MHTDHKYSSDHQCEWMDVHVCVCEHVGTEKEETREQDWSQRDKEKSKRGVPQAEESSCYLGLLRPTIF